MAEIEPSLYAADFSRLGEQIDVLLDAGCRSFHFDVGDGHFVVLRQHGLIIVSCTKSSSTPPTCDFT